MTPPAGPRDDCPEEALHSAAPCYDLSAAASILTDMNVSQSPKSCHFSSRVVPVMSGGAASFAPSAVMSGAFRRGVFGVVSLLSCGPWGDAMAAPLTFDLGSHVDAVAIQFDVAKVGGASFQLSDPQVLMDSPHAVESALLASGLTRFVVYSTAGQKISPDGKVRVSFNSPRTATGGSLNISGVMASDAAGHRVASSPNALPVLVGSPPGYRSAEAGKAISFTAPTVDLDGSVVSVDFNIGGVSRGTASASPFAFSWTPTVTGTLPFDLNVTDNKGGLATLNFGTLQTYHQSDISSFSNYTAIHYGPTAHPTDYGFNADPLGTGTANGIGYLLGLNPHSPDRSRLPQGSVAFNGGQYHFVFRFLRAASAPGVSWSVEESGGLAGWSAASNFLMTEVPSADGFTEVTVQRSLGSNPPARFFMQLNAAQ